MALPHSRFILEAFDRLDGVCEILALGPANRSDAASIFSVPDRMREPLRKTRFVAVATLRLHPRTCTFRDWKRHISKFAPDVIVVLDEALSLNALLAGLANKQAARGAVVLFYQFENLVKGIDPRQFAEVRSAASFLALARKCLRYAVVHRLVTPLRRKNISAGLVSYGECADVVSASGWNPPMRQQWWAVNDAVFRATGAKAELDLATSFKIGFVGRFVPEKGVLDLIAALARLDERFGLVLVGDGPQRPEIEAEIAAKGLQSRSRIIPAQNQENLAAYYRAFDLLVVPSRTTAEWKEQYGRVIMEAMRCGTPVIGSNSGAIPVVIGRPSLVFPEGDATAIARMIESVCAVPPEPAFLALRAMNCGADDFARAWLALADALAAGRQTPAPSR